MAAPSPIARPPVLTHGPVRLWAAGSLLTVGLILAATLAGHALASRAWAAAERVPPPALPVPDIAAAVPLDGGPRLLALDAPADRVIVYVTSMTDTCPPGASCQGSASPALVLFDESGRLVGSVPLAGDPVAANAAWLLCDAATRTALLIGPQGVARYAVMTGAPLGTYTLPSGARPGDAVGAALGNNGTLYLAGSWGLAALDEASGQVLARQTIGPARDVQGPVFAPGTNQLFLVITAPGGQMTLRIYDASSLDLRATLSLPAGTRLGPLDPLGRLVFFTPSSTLLWQAPASTADVAPSSLPGAVARLPAAQALGWNPALGHLFAEAAGTLRFEGEDGLVLAALPLAPTWLATLPLPVDPALGLLYLPVAPQTLLVVRDAARPARTALDATQAAILARFALSRLLPPPDQTPPFFTAASFPLTGATARLSLWVHSADLGWLGPYAGQTTTQTQTLSGGAFEVDYTLTWQQLFTRTHVWRLTVGADGAVRLVGERGDALP